MVSGPIRGEFRVLPRCLSFAAAPAGPGCTAGGQLRPVGIGARPSIAPLEQNVVLTIDVSGALAVSSIQTVSATATTSDGSTGTAQIADVTSSFIRALSWTTNSVSLTVGHGAQVVGQTYVVHLTVQEAPPGPPHSHWLMLPCWA